MKGRSFGSRFQHWIFYVVIGTFGKRAARALLRLVVFWYVAFRPAVREQAGHYLRRRFPAHGGWARARDAPSLSRECRVFHHSQKPSRLAPR